MEVGTSKPSRALKEAMAGDQAQVRATPALAFAKAREVVRAGDRLDMASLARDIGVGRSTLYRWTGDRDQLLADVAWAELATILDYLKSTTVGTGGPYIERIAEDFLAALATNPALRAFFENEGDSGLRLVTTPKGTFRTQMVEAVRDLIQEQVDSGAYQPPDTPRMLAEIFVFLGERYLYGGRDPDFDPDPAIATKVITLLLRES